MQVRTLQHETVDALCHRHLGQTTGTVEATLDLNPGLVQYGPFLPAGVLVTLTAPQPKVKKLIQLWN